MARSDLVLVLVDTSLNTHLAIAISPHDTVASIKRMIIAEHPVAFPVMGEIIVRAVKIGLKGVMFKLSDSIPVSTLLNDGPILCYVEAVTTNHEVPQKSGAMSDNTEASKENEPKPEMIISEKTDESIIMVSTINDGENMGNCRRQVKRKKGGEGHTRNLSPSPGPIATRLRRRLYGI